MQPESWSGLPTGPQTPDHLLRGAVDLHHHGFPEFTLDHPTRLDDAAELAHARAAGMAGIVLKSHFFPTTTARGAGARRSPWQRSQVVWRIVRSRIARHSGSSDLACHWSTWPHRPGQEAVKFSSSEKEAPSFSMRTL